MKKNIIIVILSIMTFSMLLFSYAQKIRAEQSEKIAVEMKEQFEEQKVIANSQKMIADSIAIILLNERKMAEKEAEIAAEAREEALRKYGKK